MISVNDDDSNDKVRATSSKKRHLSKRERKDLKRARTSGGGGNSKLQQQQQQQQDDSCVAEDDVTSSSSSLMNGNEKIKKRRKKKQKTREVSIHATSAMSRFSSSSFSPSATTIATTTKSNANVNINNSISSNNNNTTVLEEYAIAMSDPEPILLSELRCTTRSTLPCATHMLSGRLQGRLLSTLVTITNSTRILEIGTFTGYATQCLVEGVNEVLLQCRNQDGNNTNNANSSNVEKKGIVVTCEIDNEAADIAREYFTKQQQQQQSSSSSSSLSECSNSNSNGNINSKNATTIELIRGPAMETLRQLQADINNRTSEPFDFVFLDADKRCYIRYYEYLMSNSILKVGGVILADNVLFKGLVINNVSSNNDDDDTTKCIEVETTNITTKKEIETSSPPPKQKLNYWKRRHQDIANTVHEFNTYVNADCRSSVVLLPLRDGLSIIRKKK